MRKSIFTAVLFLTAGTSALASAQVMTPQGGGGTYYQQQPQQQPVQEETAQQGRGIQYGAHLLFPFYVTNPLARNTVTFPDGSMAAADISAGFGLGLQGRVGWEFGYGFSVEANIGILFNLLHAQPDGTGETFDVEGTLWGFWIGAGLRYAFLNPSAFVPFVGAGISLNFWGYCPDNAAVCESQVIGIVPNALVGFAFEISPWAAIEAGLQANFGVGADAVFAEAGEVEVYLTPFAGGTLYYD
jgi:opacity protein-like surface antigen